MITENQIRKKIITVAEEMVKRYENFIQDINTLNDRKEYIRYVDNVIRDESRCILCKTGYRIKERIAPDKSMCDYCIYNFGRDKTVSFYCTSAKIVGNLSSFNYIYSPLSTVGGFEGTDSEKSIIIRAATKRIKTLKRLIKKEKEK